jgi:CelD/BcsL family acetyltransferase involved in cellulose biosynthesis
MNFKNKSLIDYQILGGVDASRLEQLWRDLEARSDCEFFLSWDWIGCWIAETGIEMQLIIGRASGNVVLLGLLVPTERRSRVPLNISGVCLHTTGDANQDVITIEYNGFLVARECPGHHPGTTEDAAIRFLLDKQAGSAGPASDSPAVSSPAVNSIDELYLRNTAGTYVQDPDCFEVPVLRELVWSKPSWRVDLDAVRATGRNYIDSISANTRQQIRRSMRLYEKQGKLVVTRARDVPEALEFLDGLKDLHQPYWTSRGQPGAFAFPFFERFQRRLIETCHSHGRVELIRVARGDTAIGYLYNLVFRRQVYSYQSGFLFEADPKLKPGLVSHCLCIEMHEREQDGVYDFMAGNNRYKANLGTPGPDMNYVVLRRPTVPIRLEIGLRTLRNRVRMLARS